MPHITLINLMLNIIKPILVSILKITCVYILCLHEKEKKGFKIDCKIFVAQI